MYQWYKQGMRYFTCVICFEPASRDRGPTQTCMSCARKIQEESSRCSILVKKAILRGELKRATDFKCVDCGLPATHYDHRDYRKPLKVEPVCHGCNICRGTAKPFDMTGVTKRVRKKVNESADRSTASPVPHDSRRNRARRNRARNNGAA